MVFLPWIASAYMQKKPQRTTRKGFQAPVGKINEILKQATKNDLNAIKSQWGEIIEQLTSIKCVHRQLY